MTTMLETIVRRSTAVSLASAATLVAVAGPASADVPEGWAPHTEVNGLHAVLVLGGVPLLLFVVIFALGYLPGMLRGERTPGSSPAEDQWFGGPRKGTAELAGPDTEESKAGGASARW